MHLDCKQVDSLLYGLREAASPLGTSVFSSAKWEEKFPPYPTMGGFRMISELRAKRVNSLLCDVHPGFCKRGPQCCAS